MGKLLKSRRTTAPEMILLAAHQLIEDGLATFTAENLTVAAWKNFPRTFGLRGFEDAYPNLNAVLVNVVGKRGLVARGLLAKEGAKLYSLTSAGLDAVLTLLEN